MKYWSLYSLRQRPRWPLLILMSTRGSSHTWETAPAFMLQSPGSVKDMFLFTLIQGMNAGFFFFFLFFPIYKQATIHLNSNRLSGASVRPPHFHTPHWVTTSPRTHSKTVLLPTNLEAISLLCADAACWTDSFVLNETPLLKNLSQRHNDWNNNDNETFPTNNPWPNLALTV